MTQELICKFACVLSVVDALQQAWHIDQEKRKEAQEFLTQCEDGQYDSLDKGDEGSFYLLLARMIQPGQHDVTKNEALWFQIVLLLKNALGKNLPSYNL